MEWSTIRSQADIDTLMKMYGGFHDSCITGIQYENGNQVDDSRAMSWGSKEQFKLVMSLQRQGIPRDLELCFTGLRRINLSGCDTRFFSMMDCFLSFWGPYIVWADGECFDPAHPVKEGQLTGDMYTFVVADRLQWRFTTENRK